MRESVAPDPVPSDPTAGTSPARRTDGARRYLVGRSSARSLSVVPPTPGDLVVETESDSEPIEALEGIETVVSESVTEDLPDAPAFERDAYLAELELRLRELVEIERMRDLEIHRLEAEVELQSARITELETALFHAERRGNDLDRRWNELARVYERNAAALVTAGAQLEQIHRQTSYRLVLAVSRGLRRMPGLYAWLRKMTGLVAPRDR